MTSRFFYTLLAEQNPDNTTLIETFVLTSKADLFVMYDNRDVILYSLVKGTPPALDSVSSQVISSTTFPNGIKIGANKWSIDGATDFKIIQATTPNDPIIKIYETPVDPGGLGTAVKVNIDAKTTIKELEFGGW